MKTKKPDIQFNARLTAMQRFHPKHTLICPDYNQKFPETSYKKRPARAFFLHICKQI